MSELEYSRERRRLNDEHNVITSLSELSGWTIQVLRRWKPGAVQYQAVRQIGSAWEQKIGYAKDEVFASLQLPP